MGKTNGNIVAVDFQSTKETKPSTTFTVKPVEPSKAVRRYDGDYSETGFVRSTNPDYTYGEPLPYHLKEGREPSGKTKVHGLCMG